MNRPLISYVVTAYNIEGFIRESIECAFAQTYSPLEIVLSDDCSSDRTFEIMEQMAKSYKGPHNVKLNRNEHNLGITRHMNKAYLELAEGEIIIAAHGDDISIPERTVISYDILSKYSDVTAISLSMLSINSGGGKVHTDDACVNTIRFYDFDDGGNIPAPSRAFYKNVMTEFGPLDDSCPTEDELITTRALMMGRNVFLPQIGVYYRKHKGSSSNPENFAKFPLELIFKQQKKDIELGIKLGYITKDQAYKKLSQLQAGIILREQYRKYFANPTLIALLRMMILSNFPIRTKLYYIRSHFRRYILNRSNSSN